MLSNVRKSESGCANRRCAASACCCLSIGRSRGSWMLSPAAITSTSRNARSVRPWRIMRPTVGSTGSRANSRPISVSGRASSPAASTSSAPISSSSRYPERIAFGAGGLINGNRSMSPRPNAFSRKITSARFARRISGSVNRGRSKKSFSENRRMHTPSATRPLRPLRWSALDCDTGSIGSRRVREAAV